MQGLNVTKPGCNRAIDEQLCTANNMDNTCTTSATSTFLTHADQATLAHARRTVAAAIGSVAVQFGRRDHTCSMDRDVIGPNLDDLDYVRDLIDFFGAGQFASNKYQRGRLAGLAVSWSRHAGEEPVTTIEVVGPLFDDELDLEPVGWLDELPPLGWRDEVSNTLFRVDLALIAHLAAEAREAAERRDLAQNLFDLSDGSVSNRQAQAEGKALRDSSRSADLVDMVCALNKFKLVGLAPDHCAVNGNDDEIAYRADTLDWVFEGDDFIDDDFVIRLKTSSPQKLTVILRTSDGEDVEHELGRVRDLCDILGDRVEAMRCAGDRSAA